MQTVLAASTVPALQTLAARVLVEPQVLDYAVRLVRATRERTPLIVVNGGDELAGNATTLPSPFRLDVLRREVLTTIVANVKREAAEPVLKTA